MIFDLLTGVEGSTIASFTDPVIIEKDRNILRALDARMAELSPIDFDFIRISFRKALKITKANNCHVEINMKDNHVLTNHPENAIRWCQIAKEEAFSS